MRNALAGGTSQIPEVEIRCRQGGAKTPYISVEFPAIN